MKKRILKYSLIGALLVAVVWYFFIRPSSLISIVKRVEVKNIVVTRTVSANGEVKAKKQASLSFMSSGRIISINVSEGDTVKAGQLLAYIDTSAVRETVQSYKDARDLALRTKELFIRQKDTNVETLGGEGAYNIKLKYYEEALSQAEAAYQAQVAIMANSYIYSPFEGTVTKISKKVGETAVAGEKVLEIADLNSYYFEVSVDQEDFGYLKKGQSVSITLDSYDKYSFKSTIEKTPVTADAVTGSFVLEIPIAEDNEHTLASGMTGDAYVEVLSTNKSVNALTIDEIFYDTANNPYVWVVENGKIKKLNIFLGVEGDLYTEIKTDIKEVYVSAVENQKIIEGYSARIIN